jgi:GNAT superfamily N-acetyltransferase
MFDSAVVAATKSSDASAQIASVDQSQRDRALATMAIAFSADPFWRWLCPEAASYLTTFPRAIRLLDGHAFEMGSAWEFGDFAAVAIWMPPGVEGDFAGALALIHSIIAPEKLDQANEIAAQMIDMLPRTPCWHLSWLGTDVTAQGGGSGTRLLRQGLEVVDRDHLPVYLESSNPRNLSLYRRHNFEEIGEISSSNSPPIVAMLRPSQ